MFFSRPHHGSRTDRSPGNDGRRDSHARVISLGLVVPTGLVLWATLNAALGAAAFPIHDQRSYPLRIAIVWMEEPVGIVTVVVLKLAIASALFGWFFMANREEWMKWSQVTAFVGGCVAALAFVVATAIAGSQ